MSVYGLFNPQVFEKPVSPMGQEKVDGGPVAGSSWKALSLAVLLAALKTCSFSHRSEPLENKRPDSCIHAQCLFLEEPSQRAEHTNPQGGAGFLPRGFPPPSPHPLFSLGGRRAVPRVPSKFTSARAAGVMPSWGPQHTQQDVTQDSEM